MSVNIKTYIGVYAEVMKNVFSEYSDVYAEELIPYVEGHKDVKFDAVYDGMCGNYLYFGKTLEKFGDYEAFESAEMDLVDMKSLITEVETELIKLRLMSEDVQIKFMVFNHYS